jgi:hypothetical protein
MAYGKFLPKYSGNPQLQHHPGFFNNPDVPEANRLYELELRLVPMNRIPYHYVWIHPHPSTRIAKYPNLYFTGTSIGINQNAVVNGSVSMGDDGVVRWRFVSWFTFFNRLVLYLPMLIKTVKATIYNDNPRYSYVAVYFQSITNYILTIYSSEAIQVGNVGSAAGVIGAWSRYYHDIGLFCYCDLKSLLTYITCL